MELWTERGILTTNDFKVIEEIVTTPRDNGRIPLKIGSGFSLYFRPMTKLDYHNFICCIKVITSSRLFMMLVNVCQNL